MGSEFGVVKWDRRIRNTGHRGAWEVNFEIGVERLLETSEELIPILNSLPERPVSTREFKHLWLQSSRIVGREAADILFGVNETRRKNLRTLRKRGFDVETGLNAWDVFNALSQCARDLSHVPGLAMQDIAGQLLRRENARY